MSPDCTRLGLTYRNQWLIEVRAKVKVKVRVRVRVRVRVNDTPG